MLFTFGVEKDGRRRDLLGRLKFPGKGWEARKGNGGPNSFVHQLEDWRVPVAAGVRLDVEGFGRAGVVLGWAGKG